ncbi:MAG: hypothetical protein IKH30_12130 [Clostridia bacterium]|nr:hypothetical protein [Clostridia bacterium]
MKRMLTKRGRTWLTVFLSTLALHYLMLALHLLTASGSFSFQQLGELIVKRLMEPGDATRYIDVAQHGYVTQGENAINLVFYPLYPLLMRWLGWLTFSLPLAGVIISHVGYGVASVLLYELILLDGDRRSAWDGVLLMALYPFSMFALGVFTEGIFLALSIGCLYALRKRNFPAAGIVGFLAALTRTQGMLLFFPAVYEWVTMRFGPGKEKLRCQDAFLLLIPAGFCVYLGINAALWGNCFQFLRFEAGEPWYQSTQWVGENIAQHVTLGQQYPGLAWIIYYVQIALYFSVLAVLAYGVYKKERMAYLLYGGVYLGFSYLSGWMISGGRYMLCCVPVYIILAKLKDGLPRRLLLAGAAMLFFLYSRMYLLGYAIM